MTAPNAELAYRVLDHIDAHPEQHNQHVWIERVSDCGTAACFAGWACLLAGDLPEYEDDFDLETNEVRTSSGYDSVMFRAATLLNIEPDGGPEGVGGIKLFAVENTRDHLGCLVAEIFGPRPAVTS